MKYVPKSMCSKLKGICKNAAFRGIGVNEQLDHLADTLKQGNRPADIFDALVPLEAALTNAGHADKAKVISDILGAIMAP